MTLYKAKIREDIRTSDQFYGMFFNPLDRGKIIYLSDDNGSYNNIEEGGKSKYKGRKRCDNIGHIYCWADSCFEWVEEI